MSLGVNAFRPPGTAGATHLWVAADGETVIAKGTTPKGRAATWLSEAFGKGKSYNRAAIRAFVQAVKRDYGDQAGDAVRQQLKARFDAGKPLSSRHVEAAIASVESQQGQANEQAAAELADLDAPAIRDLIRMQVENSVLLPEEAEALLAPGDARTKLEADIKQAVLDAPKTLGSLVTPYQAVVAAKGAVDRTARDIQWNQTAANLADLGDEDRNTPARAMVQKRVEDGRLLPDEAAALLAPGDARDKLQEDIKRAVLASRELNEDPSWMAGNQVDGAVINIAKPRMTAYVNAVKEELFPPRPDAPLNPRLMDSARRVFAGLGLKPSDEELAGMMPAPWRERAAVRIGSALTIGGRIATAEQLDGLIDAEMTRMASSAVLDSLKQGGEAAQRVLGGLFDDVDPSGAKKQMLADVSQALHPRADDPSLRGAADAFDAALLRACRAHHDSSPEDAQKTRTFLESFEVDRDWMFPRLSPERQHELLQLDADLDEASLYAAARTGDPVPDTLRNNAAKSIADLVTLRIREIQGAHHCNEATAIDMLERNDPGLVRRLDGVLAVGVEHPTPGAWLRTRKQLAQMREQARSMAGGDFSGTDMQRLISGKMREITMGVFEDAARSLPRPPAPVTVYSIGSSARGEASPYSDLEFGVLLPKGYSAGDLAYVDEMNQRVRNHLAAVGEQESRVGGEGFHLDSKVLEAKADSRRAFVGSADELADVFRNSNQEWQRTAIVNAEWLYSTDVSRNEDGGWEDRGQSFQGLKDFQDRLADSLAEDHSPARAGQEIWRWTTQQALDLSSDGLLNRDVGVVNVKQLARLPMLLVQGLAEQHGLMRDDRTGVAANNIDQRLTLLVENGKISQKDADAIRDLQDKLSEVRVRSHLQHGKQVDDVALTPDAAGVGPDALLHDPQLEGLVNQVQDLSDRTRSYLAHPRDRF